MSFSTVYFLLSQTLYCMIPLLIVALAGMFSEKCGIINIALEGLMMVGAFAGVYFIRTMQLQFGFSGQWLLVAAMLIGSAAAVAVAWLHGFVSISLCAHQVISGISINLLVPAISIIIAKAALDSLQVGYTNTFRIDAVPYLSQIPVIGPILFTKTYITTFIGFAILLAAAILLYKTRFGMRLQACGENPHAADSVGVSVRRIRYIGVLISGLLAGIGGVAWIIPNTTEYGATVSGYGFLALAVLVFGQWKPKRILFASFFFGFAKTLASVYTGIPALLYSGVNSYAFKMIPYVATLIVLSITSTRGRGPAALGEIYNKEAK